MRKTIAVLAILAGMCYSCEKKEDPKYAGEFVLSSEKLLSDQLYSYYGFTFEGGKISVYSAGISITADLYAIFNDFNEEVTLQSSNVVDAFYNNGDFQNAGEAESFYNGYAEVTTNNFQAQASNVNVNAAIQRGNFRVDLFYRLSSVPIEVPPLRQRKEDIPILFRKFAIDFAERNRMPSISLTEDAQEMLVNYRWPGNIRQLKNIVEQISIIEEERLITYEVLRSYLPDYNEMKLPAVYDAVDQKTFSTEREILYKILFDMRNDVNELKKLVHNNLYKEGHEKEIHHGSAHSIPKVFEDIVPIEQEEKHQKRFKYSDHEGEGIQDTQEIVEESLSLADKEIELIRQALDRHNGKRKYAANELGISERTLYRKIKEYNIE